MAEKRLIRVPTDRYNMAKELKTRYLKEKGINMELWRCMMVLEEANKDNPLFSKNDPFTVGKRKL